MSKNLVQLRQPAYGLIGIVRLDNALVSIKEMLKLGLTWIQLNINLENSCNLNYLEDLKQVLHAQRNVECIININIKTNLKQSIENSYIFYQFIQDYNIKHIMISCLDYSFLSNLKKLLPKIAVCWQLPMLNDLTLPIAKSKGFQAINCNGKGINKKFIITANQLGIIILATANTPATAQKWLEYGALVCTESPKQLLK